MRFLHTMVRVSDLEASLKFYCDGLGLTEISRYDSEQGRFSLIFLATPEDVAAAGYEGGKIPEGLPCVELTHNWDPEDYQGGRNFGHLAYRMDNVYEACQRLMDMGVTINRPPRDGHMAFVRSPDGISVELLQRGENLPPQEPWASMENTGSW
ncbi:lactoylglutathione lyase [uncultured Maricaulis sp.]|uniref:VOC family protein n=1 Tax=uncultured Maricaulis sp. TaxID=174710 RepID=UPI0030DC5FEB